MLLHVACGNRILDGWINRDLHRAPDGTRPFNAAAPWEYPTNSADAVYCEDFFEHLTQPDQIVFLAEACRVLKKNGIIRINCPDLVWAMKNKIVGVGVRSGGYACINLDSEFYKIPGGHECLPTSGYLIHMLTAIGFRQPTLMERNVSNIPGFPGDSRPLDDRPNEGNLFIEAVK